ncbi:hypothetical protein [Staphylococcus hyicus]|uniref:hypothetical protein n=1 Tax=Staphylococcus hyicus TaxID=1284 RepID=UPI0031333DDF
MKIHFNGMIYYLNIDGHRYLLHNEVDEIAYDHIMRDLPNEEEVEALYEKLQLIHDAISNKEIEKLCELDLEDLDQTFRFNHVDHTLIELLKSANYNVEEIRNDVYIIENDEGQLVKLSDRAHVTDCEYKHVLISKNTTVTKKQLERMKLNNINSNEDTFYF